MTTDPFAATGTTATEDDPFGTVERSRFPKPGALIGKLLVMSPVKVEKVPGKQGGLVDRWSVDTLVVNEDGTYEAYDAMYWSQKGIATAMSKAAQNRRPVAATLHLYPAQDTTKKYTTEDQLLADEAIQFWLGRGGAGMPPMSVAWGLEQATDEEKPRAIKAYQAWQASKNPFAS